MNISVAEKVMMITTSLIFIVIALGLILVFNSVGLLWNPFSILIISLVLLFAFLPVIKSRYLREDENNVENKEPKESR